MLRQVETVVSNHGLWVGPNLLRRLITSSVSTRAADARGHRFRFDTLSARNARSPSR